MRKGSKRLKENRFAIHIAHMCVPKRTFFRYIFNSIRAKFESVLALVFMTMLYGFKDAFWLKIQLSCELK